MSSESLDPAGGGEAKFVASEPGRFYYRADDPGRPRQESGALRWFASEGEARAAGLQPRPEDRPGLEEFEFLGELGRGGTATVFHARDRMLGRDVAIKLIRPTHHDDEESLARFAREARVVARLQHPNIASVYAVRQLPGGGLALVMEYVPGTTLRDLILREAPLPIARAEAILRDVGEALVAAHAQGIVHRDVKPQNIFLHETTGRAILADFGIAIPLQDTTRITHAGSVIGTPAYMSPEQFDGGELDGRSDLYSLGLVGWEMLTGVSPWEGESLYNIIYKQKQESLPSLRKLRPGTPPRLRFAIEGALAKKPDQRWSGVEEFLSNLSGETRGWWWRLWTLELFRSPVEAESEAAEVQTEAEAAAGAAPFAEALPPTPPDAATVRFEPGTDPRAPLSPPPPLPPSRRRRRSPRLGWVAGAAVLFLGVVGLAIASDGLRSPAGRTDTRVEPAGLPLPATPLPSARGAAPGDAPSDSGFRAAGAGSLALEAGEALAGDSAPGVDTLAALLPEGAEADDDTAGVDTSATEPVEGPVAPPAVEPVLIEVDRSRAALAAGGMHSCAIDGSGSVACWGGNDRGQLGIGGGTRETAPVPVEVGSNAQSVVAGAFHSCMLDAWGAAFCWGENRDGQLGGGTLGLTTGVVSIAQPRFVALALGVSHSCGIARGGGTYCWGSDAEGQLGTGTSRASSTPLRVRAERELVRLTAGWNHTCGLTRQGQAFCWGQNSRGQLGDGSTISRSMPTPVAGQLRFTLITAGSAHTCALTAQGEAFCWGQNGNGQLGDGSTAIRSAPARVQTSQRFARIAAGGGHTCGITLAGTAFCWGQNNYGQLGDGSTTSRMTPFAVQGDIRFERVQAGGSHSCGLSSAGVTYCWGYNIEGQLGDGTLAHRTEPQPIRAADGGAE